MKKFILFSVTAIISLFIIRCSAENNSTVYSDTDSIYVASWNVENLFDTIDDPNTNDEEYTPSGRREWTTERLNHKLENLTKVIKFMNNGEGPDLLGIQEVEHQSLLDTLNKKIKSNKNYKIAYAESLDKRGIDVGLMYNSELFILKSLDTLRVDLADGWLTRYILYSEFQIIGSDIILHVFVNHWPSRSGGNEKSEPNRIAAAEVLKNYTDRLFSENKKANIIIMGDFNDDPSNTSIYNILSAQELICDMPGDNNLYNTSSDLYKKGKGTYLFRKSWNMLDQIIISRSIVDKSEFSYKCFSFEIIKPIFMINKEGAYAGSAERTFGGKNYIGGYSDHYPVGAKFTYKK